MIILLRKSSYSGFEYASTFHGVKEDIIKNYKPDASNESVEITEIEMWYLDFDRVAGRTIGFIPGQLIKTWIRKYKTFEEKNT